MSSERGPTACQNCASKKVKCIRAEDPATERCDPCEKADMECVEQIPAREQQKQPDTAAKVLEDLSKSLKRRAGIAKRLAACPRDAVFDEQIIIVRAIMKSSLDALEVCRTPVLGPATTPAAASKGRKWQR
ncbi:hypothetical protein B0T18DRAFT_433169 [Schizothecium vesticola]|uniref:Zn(2)-C6 fungal-type domain-containing protein n=1 Tax=Schizothecium vesticola TaxID=314040 RepID=A0AA40EII7_9PEZI|nr:hypothetical protein B0T18DRAFT_433169 [Schizothecium vesticola]